MALNVTVITQPAKEIYGIWGQSSDKTVSKDITALSKKYYDVVNQKSGNVLPFYVVSKGYDEGTGQFDLFVGGEISSKQLEIYGLPMGLYGRTIIKPKFGLLWGLAIGKAKQEFYTKWLPSSGYGAINMEYELHTLKSVGKKPEIDLLFAIENIS